MSKQQFVGWGLHWNLVALMGASWFTAGCSAEGSNGDIEDVSTATSALSTDVAAKAAKVEAEAAAIVAGKYFVGLKKGVTSLADTAPTVAKVGGELQRKHGGRVHRAYQYSVQALAMELSASEADTLKADPQVDYVEPVPARTLASTQVSPPSWGLDRIDQRQLPLDAKYTYPDAGANIVHAYVLDTGAYAAHTAFGGRVTGGWNFISDDSNTSDWDSWGHGTHVAGTIGSSTWGVSKQIQIHPLKVCGVHGTGMCDDTAIVDAIEWLTLNHQHPAVANMSFGGPKSQTETNAINAAIAHGITVVVCAGNNTSDACNYGPSYIPNVITVGSVDSTNTKASDSNYGTCVDLFGPGVDITSAGLTQGSSSVQSGTSMAAPHVTGVAALYLALNPKATPSAVTSALIAQTTPGIVVNPGTGSPNRMLYQGFLNAGPCDGLCTSPTNFTFPFNGSYQSGNLGKGAICRATTSTVTGGNCGNFASGRSLKVNGVTKVCNGQSWQIAPVSRNGGYCIQTTSGDYDYAYFTLWSAL